MKGIAADEVRKVLELERTKKAQKVKKHEEKKVDRAIKIMLKNKIHEAKLGKTASLQMQDYARKLGFYIKKYGNVYFLSTEPKYITTK